MAALLWRVRLGPPSTRFSYRDVAMHLINKLHEEYDTLDLEQMIEDVSVAVTVVDDDGDEITYDDDITLEIE